MLRLPENPKPYRHGHHRHQFPESIINSLLFIVFTCLVSLSTARNTYGFTHKHTLTLCRVSAHMSVTCIPPPYTTPKQTDWWKDTIRHWRECSRRWLLSGTYTSNTSSLPHMRHPMMPPASPHLSYCLKGTSGGCLMWLRRPGRCNLHHTGQMLNMYNQRILASSVDNGGQPENGIQHCQQPLAVPGSPLWPPWGSSNIPEADGHGTKASHAVLGGLPRRRNYTFSNLGRPTCTVPSSSGTVNRPGAATTREKCWGQRYNNTPVPLTSGLLFLGVTSGMDSERQHGCSLTPIHPPGPPI